MRTLLCFLFGLIGVVAQPTLQDHASVKSFRSRVERIRKAQDVEIEKIEAVSLDEFRKLKELTILEIDQARKERMAKDDLEGALALRNASEEIENTKWESTKFSKFKRTEWGFLNRDGNRLVKQVDDTWKETSNPSFVWIEKNRNECCVFLYDPKRDIAGRLYDNGFFVQFPSQRNENSWNLFEGKWIR